MLEAGKVIGDRYQLERKLGRNAGRQTWIARDLQQHNKEQVIVKLLAFGGDVEWSDLKLFEREAQILKQLDRPNIPKYKDYFSIDDRTLWFGLVQEYIPGSSLKELLDKGKRFNESEVIKIAQEILETLIYLHQLNPPLLHRDIKPSNLILGENQRIYLVDFGAVQDRAAVEGATFTVVGTYGYAPMEQFGGRTVPASDLYAVGATVIHLLTRTPPADLPHQDLKIQFRPQVTISSKLANWLDKITAPAVEKRFSNARQALAALQSDADLPQEIINNKPKLSFSNAKREPLKPFNTEVRVTKSSQELEIFIPMRGEFLLPSKLSKQSKKTLKFALLCGLFPSLVLLKILSIAPVGIIFLGLFFLPLSSIMVYALLKYLFSSSKLIINHKRFEITTQFLWSHISKTGLTENIKDVSINYVNNSSNKDVLEGVLTGDSIILSAKSLQVSHKFKRYLFGQGLSESELIWLANEIRDWLSNSL
ncbi:MAG: hypothetical protein Tsb0014_04250 [Pleurocapsa sp.]